MFVSCVSLVSVCARVVCVGVCPFVRACVCVCVAPRSAAVRVLTPGCSEVPQKVLEFCCLDRETNGFAVPDKEVLVRYRVVVSTCISAGLLVRTMFCACVCWVCACVCVCVRCVCMCVMYRVVLICVCKCSVCACVPL